MPALLAHGIFCKSMGPLRAAFVAFALAASASAQSHTFSHLAGSTGGAGSNDGPSAAARFNYPSAVAVDRAGNVYVADTTSHTIRKISGGSVSTLAGLAGEWGGRDGVGGVARFNQPGAIAVDGEETVYVADTLNGRVRRISARGHVTTLAPYVGIVYALAIDDEGSVYVARNAIQKITPGGQLLTIAGVAGSKGSSDGTGSAARFDDVMGLAVDAAGNIYAADSGSHTIRRITPEGVVTTIAGLAGSPGSSDGAGSAARFKGPHGIAVDGDGNLFVADSFNVTIRRIDPSGVVTTVAGKAGEDGIADGPGSTARFGVPLGVAAGEEGTVYVADTFNHAIRAISLTGVVDTIAGRPNEPGSNDGSGSAARFFRPYDVAVDASGIVYAADSWNHTIRRITPDGVVTTFAGSPGVTGSTDGKGTAARFAFPKGIAVDLAGNVYVSDSGNDTIRTISKDGTVSTLAGLAGSSGSDDGVGSEARFSMPTGLTVDRNGTIYVADTGNHTIRQILPVGQVSTLAGLAGAAGSADAIGAAARFNSPQDVALALEDPSDLHLLVADTANHTLRLVRNGGWVMTYSGLAGSPGDTIAGTPQSARWFFPTSLAIVPLTAFYVVDAGNQMIRAITNFGSGAFVAGSPNEVGSGNGGGFDARFNNPSGIAVDASGNLYVADVSNQAIRKGTPGGDAARIDKTTGPKGTVRQLRTYPLGTDAQAATSWRWELVRRPVGSTAELSSSTSANPLFVPDVADVFVFRLTAQNATGTSVTHVRLTATPLPRRRAVGHGE
jgi:sugar lactone lactonase YvrE